jgi:hypothetical protein
LTFLGAKLGQNGCLATIGEVRVGDLGFGPKATFSALSEAEMRFFKTHGFVKPLLREMLFRGVNLVCTIHPSETNPSRRRETNYVVIELSVLVVPPNAVQ